MLMKIIRYIAWVLTIFILCTFAGSYNVSLQERLYYKANPQIACALFSPQTHFVNWLVGFGFMLGLIYCLKDFFMKKILGNLVKSLKNFV